MSRPYLASEDSALLREALKTYSGGSALEIGAGNCGNLVMLAKGFETAVGTDIVMPGMTDWRASGADFLLADGASCLRLGYFDLVAFNPPYLLAEVADDPSTEGGVALEVPMRFLRDALRAVKLTGRIVMLLNDQAPIGEFEAECSRHGFRLSKVATRHLFFEELSVYEASAL
jgi:methylase of polypeptide subunit release factors